MADKKAVPGNTFVYRGRTYQFGEHSAEIYNMNLEYKELNGVWFTDTVSIYPQGSRAPSILQMDNIYEAFNNS